MGSNRQIPMHMLLNTVPEVASAAKKQCKIK